MSIKSWLIDVCLCDLSVSFPGVRLYFSTTPFAPPNAKHTSARPSLLSLVHVRLPPGFSASSTLQKPAKVHKALYRKGTAAPPIPFPVQRTFLPSCVRSCICLHRGRGGWALRLNTNVTFMHWIDVTKIAMNWLWWGWFLPEKCFRVQGLGLGCDTGI